jgi:hypothetical protein
MYLSVRRDGGSGTRRRNVGRVAVIPGIAVVREVVERGGDEG